MCVIKKSIWLFLSQNVCCEYSKDWKERYQWLLFYEMVCWKLSQWDNSFEHSKQMFKLMDKTECSTFYVYLYLWLTHTSLQINVRNWKLFILFLNQNICCVYSKEPSQWDGSFEHSHHMFTLLGKKVITILRSNILLNWTYAHISLAYFFVGHRQRMQTQIKVSTVCLQNVELKLK